MPDQATDFHTVRLQFDADWHKHSREHGEVSPDKYSIVELRQISPPENSASMFQQQRTLAIRLAILNEVASLQLQAGWHLCFFPNKTTTRYLSTRKMLLALSDKFSQDFFRSRSMSFRKTRQSMHPRHSEIHGFVCLLRPTPTTSLKVNAILKKRF